MRQNKAYDGIKVVFYDLRVPKKQKKCFMIFKSKYEFLINRNVLVVVVAVVIALSKPSSF